MEKNRKMNGTPTATTKVLSDSRTSRSACDISFIIPCKNEENTVHACMDSIHRSAPRDNSYEVILVDNNSEDASIRAGCSASPDVVMSHTGNVAFGRNRGAELATGRFLIFIDADVILTPEWQQRASNQWAEWEASCDTEIRGSWVASPEPPSWIEKAWFEPMRRGPKSHMNSGHFIISSTLFHDLGGFDESLETGEDYELSTRASKQGIKIINDEDLLAIHLGFPKTIKDFFARELWHGQGDVASVGAFLGSKTAIASAVACYSPLLAAWVGFQASSLWYSLLILAILPGLAVALVIKTFGKTSTKNFGDKIALALVYIFARGLAPYKVLRRSFTHKNRGEVPGKTLNS